MTPQARRSMLRAFADRMLLKISSMDDPEDMPGVERCMRTAAMIERVYSRCDRAEAHAPDPRRIAADRATNEGDAIRARVALAGTMQWGEARRRDLGPWWDAAAKTTEAPAAPAQEAPKPVIEKAPNLTAAPSVLPDNPLPPVTYVDYTDAIEAARAGIAARVNAGSTAKREQPPP